MQHGDFSTLAKSYVHRPGYAANALTCLARHVGASRANFRVADIGAGTGKLTEQLSAMGMTGYAVEPNSAMRGEAHRIFSDASQFRWHEGTAESTNLPSDSVDWVCMASAFHWADAPRALREFHRILRPAGYLTVLWNPRDLEADPFQRHIDELIHGMVPGLTRRSSGAARYTGDIEKTLLSDGWFGDVFLLEAPHIERMSPKRYIGIWSSVNDIQVQAGADRWLEILATIEKEVKGVRELAVHYRTRAWTVRAREC